MRGGIMAINEEQCNDLLKKIERDCREAVKKISELNHLKKQIIV